jgi:argininosuccinate lyase
MKLWGGRFKKPTDPVFEAFARSLESDRRLVHHDLRACTAHVLMLTDGGVIAPEDSEKLVDALRAIGEEIDGGGLEIEGSDEDIHSWVERQLSARVGTLSSSIRIGRSRNDLVVTDFRLYVMEACKELSLAVRDLQSALVRRAQEDQETILPGYTHLQRAQPVLLAHHLLAHFWALERDRGRLARAHYEADCCVLGAAALAGSSWPVHPEQTASLLGFSRALENSLDGVSDRDFALEFLFACATCATHLSRLAEELVLWSTAEFAFVAFDDAWSTGSSLMPQKKNPDPAELVRGKTGLFLGNLVDLLTTLKGMPLAYNRDLQQDKPPVFRSREELAACLAVMTGTVASLQFQEQKMAAAASDPGLLITDVADYLVRHGLPFSQAHELAGRSMGDPQELDEAEKAHIAAAWEVLTLQRAVSLRAHAGAAGHTSVERQLEKAKALLEASHKLHDEPGSEIY